MYLSVHYFCLSYYALLIEIASIGICLDYSYILFFPHISVCPNYISNLTDNTKLIFFPVTATPIPPVSPCEPNPCGPHSECRPNRDNTGFVCSCLQGFFGSPCRPECTINSDCPLSRACINYKCENPCEGSCGINTRCDVVSHNPICRCEDGLTGDPFNLCYEKRKLLSTVYLFVMIVSDLLRSK